MAILEVKNLEVFYGVIQAIKGISFEVNPGEIIALIGANGAGKTTTLQTITGLIPSKAGQIIYEGQDITKIPGHKLVSMGIAHVPEGRRVFAGLTVLQNLYLGAYTRKDKKEMEDTLEMIYERFPRLKERRDQLSGTLSGGEQQMLCHLYSFLIQILEGSLAKGSTKFTAKAVFTYMKAHGKLIEGIILLKMMIKQYPGFRKIGRQQRLGILIGMSNNTCDQNICQQSMGKQRTLVRGNS